MKNKRIIDFSDELEDIQNTIQGLSKEKEHLNNSLKSQSDSLKELELRLSKLDHSFSPNQSNFNKKPLNVYSSQYFLEQSKQIESQVQKEINSGFHLLPKLDKLDYIVATLIGVIAALVDSLIVKIPKDVTYLGKYMQKGGKLTAWLRSLGVDKDGKLNGFLADLEKNSKVSYDASTKNAFTNYEREVSGFYPKTHRLMSLGHDPLFGLLFGTLDIINGRITLIDGKGAIHQVSMENYQNLNFREMIFAPFLWLSHILSDVCTKMGIPAPGWGFTQLLQFGKIGENDRNVADLARYMYLEGYDLRHFLSMGTVPGIIELFTRVYYSLTQEKSDPFSLVYAKDIRDIQNKIRLEKLLFMAHSTAVGGNALKIVAHQGNPLAFNYPQLLAFTKQSIQIVEISKRDQTSEKIIRNRENIKDGWKEI